MPMPGTEMEFDCDTVLLSVGLIPENELSKNAGLELDRRTNGLVVYENMETSAEGIFACGNVVHVHDLVDFVTAESQAAGRSAAAYLAGNHAASKADLEVKTAGHVTYTVPQKLRLANVEQSAKLFFRVNQVMPKAIVTVRSGEETLATFRREHMAPGEMATVTIPRVLLEKANGTITVTAEPAEEI